MNFARAPRFARLAAALALCLSLGCAAAGLTPVASNQPVARQALPYEYRVFYDTLIDYGEWVLIEPYGFVFRPRVAWNQWQPFEDGFWAATDTYGWVWISAEPFGWATYHYGQWFFDKFQGWVWTPGVEWMPGSVSWLLAGNYIGWQPLASRGASAADGGSAALPATAMHFAPIARLGTTDLRTKLVLREQITSSLEDARPIQNLVRVGGVTFDRGPQIELVEAYAGPIQRTHIEDLVPLDLGERLAGPPTRGPMRSGRAALNDSSAAAARNAIDQVQRAGERAASEARRFTSLSRPAPYELLVVRPILSPRAPGTGPERAPADTTR